MLQMGMFSPYGFRALENQNAAGTQAANVAPAMPGYTGIDKLDFAQMRTPEDQIHWLYLYATGLEMDKVTAEQAQALIDAATATLKAYVNTQDQAISADVVRRYNYLLELIKQLTESDGMTFDPTYGDLRPISSTIEHVYDFDRPFSVTAIDYDTCGMTAYFYDSHEYSSRDFDTCFALLSYDFYVQLVHNGVALPAMKTH
jgi:hypothetical protein